MSISGFRGHKYKRDAKCSKFTSDEFYINYNEQATDPTFLHTVFGEIIKMPIFVGMFRRAISVILIFVVIAQIGAMWAVLTSALWVHKQTKEMRMSNSSLWVRFNFSDSEWKEFGSEKDEIEIEGKLYDIVSIIRADDVVEIIAVADHAEEDLKRNLSGLNSKAPDFSNLARLACSFSLTPYHVEETFQFAFLHYPIETSHCDIPAECICKGIYPNPEQPPAA